jgi:hypothetical protein
LHHRDSEIVKMATWNDRCLAAAERAARNIQYSNSAEVMRDYMLGWFGTILTRGQGPTVSAVGGRMWGERDARAWMRDNPK